MVSVTMSADPSPPPPYRPETGIVIFPVGSAHPRMREQINAYYEAHFRKGQMETFAQFVLEKGHGAMAPMMRVDGEDIHETWQARGRRLFGQRFIAVMEKAINEYRAAHAETAPPPTTAPLETPPAHVLEEIPEPEF